MDTQTANALTLDPSQRRIAAAHGAHVVRYVLTAPIKASIDGRRPVRTLIGPMQGRYTYRDLATAERARMELVTGTSPARLRDVYGCGPASIKVRAVACYPEHFDPMSRWFDR